MIIVPFIPFILAIGVSFYYFTTALETKTVSHLKRIVEDHREMVQSFLAERKADIEFVADTYTFETLNNPGAIQQIFTTLKKRSGAFVDLGLFSEKGVHLKYSGQYQLGGKDYRNEPWFKYVLKNGVYISDVFLGYRRVPHFIIAVRHSHQGQAWVLRATIDTLFFDRLVSQVAIGRTGEAGLLNNKGIVQTDSHLNNIRILETDPDFEKFQLPENGIRTFMMSDALGDTYLYAATWLKDRDWLMVVRQEKRDAYRQLYTAAWLSLVITIVGGAGIVMLAVLTTHRILRNIEQLGMEKENLGHQLIRATQLAEIGEMATGFAHEINNPLQIIKGEHALIDTLMEDITGDDKQQKAVSLADIRESLDQIQLQVNRCSDITHAILKFGRKNDVTLERILPAVTVPEILRMVEKKIQVSGIELVRRISETAPAFMGSPSQFQQVILNLVNNAIDAIAERHGAMGGRLSIEVGGGEDKDRDASGGTADTVRISISDNGSGISQDNLEKIFSPFFTTKPVGKGTGLGLSVCYGIIQSFGGTMRVNSQTNTGTTFVVELPVAA